MVFSTAFSTPFFTAILVRFYMDISADFNTEYLRICSMEQLAAARDYLEANGFVFGVYSDQEGVYYTAQNERDVVYADVQQAYSLQTLRDMYTECFAHLKVEE